VTTEKKSMKTISRLMLLIALLVMTLAGCSPRPILAPSATDTSAAESPTPESFIPASPSLPIPSLTPLATELPTLTPEPVEVRFAVIGDYGMDNSAEADVAALIQRWQPDLVITTGDNNYPSGAAESIDANIGKYLHGYIFPYMGTYGAGAEINRFFPSLGNHDWYTADAQPYLDYFSMPGNERYYDFTWGPLHLFAIDSDEHEPDGINASSVQAAWLKQGLADSTSPWNIVYMHYPPYSSGSHGSTAWMQWPFAAWGADAVLAGHDHLYERLLVDGIPYFTNGAGGGGLYDFGGPVPESQFRYNANYGAMLVTAGGTEILFEFTNRVGKLIDSYRVTKP
jgi:tartrate-resistant acid phosphatase type 5